MPSLPVDEEPIGARIERRALELMDADPALELNDAYDLADQEIRPPGYLGPIDEDTAREWAEQDVRDEQQAMALDAIIEREKAAGHGPGLWMLSAQRDWLVMTLPRGRRALRLRRRVASARVVSRRPERRSSRQAGRYAGVKRRATRSVSSRSDDSGGEKDPPDPSWRSPDLERRGRGDLRHVAEHLLPFLERLAREADRQVHQARVRAYVRRILHQLAGPLRGSGVLR